MTSAALKRLILIPLLALSACQLLTNCGSSSGGYFQDKRNKMIVSVNDQRMLLVRDGKPVKTYKVSTSKFGLGDQPGSNRTPIGHMRIAKKIGCKAPQGSVFKSRHRTGEILKPNAPGRDPIVTRILWLKGMEGRNKNAFRRTIYIHGTPEERRLGYPASFGCIRMSSKDIADLYDRIGYGADVFVVRGSIHNGRPSSQGSASSPSRRLNNRG
jgi:lipoprotein-anchoring transpeptidase ErfK/SrfK